MFGIKNAVKAALAEERQEAYKKLDMVVGEIQQPGYLKISEDGSLEVRWNQDSDFMGLATVIAALVSGELNQIVNNAIYNRGLANVIPGDAARASAILEQWAKTLRDIKAVQIQEILTQINEGVPLEEVPLEDENAPAVSASEAFAGDSDDDD